jgi:hypothetical protein
MKRFWSSRELTDQRGVIIVGAMIVTMLLLSISLSIAEFGINHYTSTRRTLIAANALSAADAGADDFMYHMNLDSNYKGTNGAPGAVTNTCTYTPAPVTLANNTAQGKLTYESCVKDGDLPNERYVFITGKAYLPATAANPTSTRKLRLIISNSNIGAGYTIQTGNGGLTMSNSANIGSGDFYINGRLTMSNNSNIGDASLTKPSRIWVAGDGCGTGASYPQACAGNTGQVDLPIFIGSPSAHIYGDVHAPNMTTGGTDGSQTRARMTNAGLVDGDATVTPMPDNNRATVMGRNTWVTKAASAANCPNGQNTITWTGGTHFTGGNVNVDQSCSVKVTGDVWIEGGLSMKNSASLRTDDSAPYAPNILIDGSTGFQPINNTSLSRNAAGTALQVRTFWSAAGSCPQTAPSVCPTPTGANLLTSTNTNTITFSNAFTAPGATFYAVWSSILVNNGTDIGQLLGQKVNLANSGIVTFSGPTVSGSSGGGDWNVKYYEQLFN